MLPGGTWSDPPAAQQDPSAVLPQDPEAVLPQDPEADEQWQQGSCWAGVRVATAWLMAVKTAGSVIPRFVHSCQAVVEIPQRSRNAKGGCKASRTLHSSFSRGEVHEQVV